MSGKIESEKEALGLARNAIENAACEGPFMAVVFHVKEGEIFINRTTWDFPKSKLDDAIEALKKNLEEARISTPMLPDAPLPDAEISSPPVAEHVPIELPTIKFPLKEDLDRSDGEPAPQLDTGFSNEMTSVPATPDDLDGIVTVADPQSEN